MARGKTLFDVVFRMTNYGVESHVTRKCWLKHPGTFLRVTEVQPNPRDGMRGEISGVMRFRGRAAADEAPERIRSALKREWVLLWDSARNEVVVPQELKAMPQDVQDAWEVAYFAPAREASKAPGSEKVATVHTGARAISGTSAAFDERLAAGRAAAEAAADRA
ncbi:hypothetical protein FNF27_02406 [Cafeteria roenbergensis]|uniref:Uncharacterized protein n=1 Tax=Cafeteria roenbergensis TaxID=33653 RepID=A0A5A8EFJ2_CAFRO|nr:hypothetical protein FNF29_07299 [Cafeteria roenbergensis]KAA0167500.1 hypothetical protein FNF31_00939 [Cafeteria roenbergensis]KAA0176014.1 hypothetical protein FNF27_02406 [Cafeteria roenbergensis]|eukprot:KAA0147554.1 hypothetical protein FNF29_07299 [Cafeteria roenbergensis]